MATQTQSQNSRIFSLLADGSSELYELWTKTGEAVILTVREKGTEEVKSSLWLMGAVRGLKPQKSYVRRPISSPAATQQLTRIWRRKCCSRSTTARHGAVWCSGFSSKPPSHILATRWHGRTTRSIAQNHLYP